MLRIVADACAGVHAAHLLRDRDGTLLNVVHGDIAPASLVISPAGDTRVRGFGFAKARARAGAGANRSWCSESGGPRAPPGQRVDRHADIWGLGAILDQALGDLVSPAPGVNRGPPSSASPPERGVPAPGGEAPSSRRGAAGVTSVTGTGRVVPAVARVLVERAQSLDPAERFATAAEMQGAIEAAIMTLGLPAGHARVGARLKELLGARENERTAAIAAARARLPHSAGLTTPTPSSSPPVTSVSRAPPGKRGPDLNTTGNATARTLGAIRRLSSPSFHARARRRGALGLAAAMGILVFGGATLLLRHPPSPHPEGAAHPQPPPGPATDSAPLPSPPPPAPLAPACPAGMVEIPGGTFAIGSNASTAAERPAHRATLAPFCIDALEVTTEAYKACSDVGDCKRAPTENRWAGITGRDRRADDPLCNARDPAQRAKYPINCLDWSMAAGFCAARGARLPTEAEWEAAARAGDGRAQDLVGNLREWTLDWFAPYAPADATDPRGPAAGTLRVARGGAFDLKRGTDPALRYPSDPSVRSFRVGFRCARSLLGP